MQALVIGSGTTFCLLALGFSFLPSHGISYPLFDFVLSFNARLKGFGEAVQLSPILVILIMDVKLPNMQDVPRAIGFWIFAIKFQD
jgi:hypothetical protein